MDQLQGPNETTEQYLQRLREQSENRTYLEKLYDYMYYGHNDKYIEVFNKNLSKLFSEINSDNNYLEYYEQIYSINHRLVNYLDDLTKSINKNLKNYNEYTSKKIKDQIKIINDYFVLLKYVFK